MHSYIWVFCFVLMKWLRRRTGIALQLAQKRWERSNLLFAWPHSCLFIAL
jgi:hypothetical protein